MFKELIQKQRNFLENNEIEHYDNLVIATEQSQEQLMLIRKYQTKFSTSGQLMMS